MISTTAISELRSTRSINPRPRASSQLAAAEWGPGVSACARSSRKCVFVSIAAVALCGADSGVGCTPSCACRNLAFCSRIAEPSRELAADLAVVSSSNDFNPDNPVLAGLSSLFVWMRAEGDDDFAPSVCPVVAVGLIAAAGTRIRMRVLSSARAMAGLAVTESGRRRCRGRIASCGSIMKRTFLGNKLALADLQTVAVASARDVPAAQTETLFRFIGLCLCRP
jgi:hypothetical protein